MTFGVFVSKVRGRLPLFLQFLIEVLCYWIKLCRYNASINTERDCKKMQYTLLRQNHIIEKGLSMRNTRKGFGQEKVLNLIHRLSLYDERYGKNDKSFLMYPLSTIKEYIAFQNNNGIEIPVIKKAFEDLCAKVGFNPDDLQMAAGVQLVDRNDIINDARGDYASLLYSRHSVRYFKDELPDRGTIEEALVLASRTPSACNRQAWHTHVYTGGDCHKLLRMQGGCNGFCDDIHCAVVVTSDMKGFLGHEPFQCYIDGGLYAQNLINALHYVGLGGIPLSCGFMSDSLSRMQKEFAIPANEVMIVIIGVGVLNEQTKIAVSARRPLTDTNTFH